jgi:hypothetical protein
LFVSRLWILRAEWLFDAEIKHAYLQDDILEWLVLMTCSVEESLRWINWWLGGVNKNLLTVAIKDIASRSTCGSNEMELMQIPACRLPTMMSDKPLVLPEEGANA